MTEYSIRKVGYDPFINYIKGIAIIWVLYLHTVPALGDTGAPFWALMAVPLFLLVQVFHVVKLEEVKWPSFRKVAKRIFVPFFIVQIILLSVKLTVNPCEFITIIKNFVVGGGFGPGAYYPWLYIQMSIIIPIFYYFIKRFGSIWGGLIILIASIVLEVVCCSIGLPDTVWRLLCFRYIYLIWLGYILIEKGIRLSTIRIALSLISVFFIYFFYYRDLHFAPFFIETDWSVHRWICYFYVSYFLLWLVLCLYSISAKRVNIIIETLGKMSYEVFLSQMFFISLFNSLGDIGLRLPLYINIPLVWILSFSVGLLWYRIRMKGQQKYEVTNNQ